jgi:23S rRNA-intervening sequence protein
MGFIPPHGGYRNLLSYRKAEIVYDITVRFCRRFLEQRDRTVDQMVQAARSGKQNIAEGSQASATSTETEIKLTSVARASLEELRVDYGTCGFGRRTRPKRATSASSRRCRSRRFEASAKPVRPKQSPISPSA